MIKLTFFIRRHPDWTPEAFAEYWQENHAQLIARHAPAFGIRRYVQTHPVQTHPVPPLEGAPPVYDSSRYDGIAELWFESRGHLELWFRNTTPESAAAGREIRADERKFIDRANTPYLIGEEVVVIGGGNNQEKRLPDPR